MAFTDELTIYAKAGKGGDGAVRWLHLKYREFSGPAGGDGGRGGNVYAEGIRDIGQLGKLSYQKNYYAKDGEPGGNQSKHGANGEDLVIPMPIGSVISNIETGEKWELIKEGDRVLLLKGGAGGFGNEHFKSSTNQAPEHANPGRAGEEGTLHIELQLVVDAGFVGLPNAGKSSLLNALTNAQAKVGDYQFTTLDPNLGALYGYILADIPGLIEGASEGKGLGHKFLRHIKRTKLVFHCVSLERESPEDDYETIRKELEKYENLAEKREVVILTKTDAAPPERVREVQKTLEKYNSDILTVTILDDEVVKKLRDKMIEILRTI